jgi:protein O-mannosyl-transferase
MNGNKAGLLSRITNANPVYFLIFILFLTAISYVNTLNSPLVLDDRNSFIESRQLYFVDFTPDSIKELISTRFGLTRAIPLLTFALNHKYAQGQAIYYHLTNIFIHLLTTVALFIFLRQLANLPNASKNLVLLPATLFTIGITGLWALSPVQTNAVTYLVQRMTSLGALFYLTTIIFYLHARQAGNFSTKLAGFAAALFSLLCAALSKENTATLPLALLMLEEMFLAPGLIAKLSSGSLGQPGWSSFC